MVSARKAPGRDACHASAWFPFVSLSQAEERKRAREVVSSVRLECEHPVFIDPVVKCSIDGLACELSLECVFNDPKGSHCQMKSNEESSVIIEDYIDLLTHQGNSMEQK